MQLILGRHAEAEDANGDDDLARALTKKGHRQAERMARWLRPRLIGDWRILVSPSKRTLQTVEPLDREYAVENAVAPDASAWSIPEIGSPTSNLPGYPPDAITTQTEASFDQRKSPSLTRPSIEASSASSRSLSRRMRMGCKRIMSTELIPNHQNRRLSPSSKEKPIKTYQARKVATLKPTVSA